LANRLVPLKNVFLHILLISLAYVGFFFVVLGSLKVYSDYKSFARDVLNAQNIATCPTVCSFNLTSQWRDPRAVIVVDNPSGTPVVLRLSTTQHREVWVATDRTTRINITFDGGLYVDVYPLYPLSDAEPRSAYLPDSGNLTIRVIPPAIGGVLQTLQAIIGAVIGLLTTLGIIKYVTKNLAVYVIGSTSPNFVVVIIVAIIFSLIFVVLFNSLIPLFNLIPLSLTFTIALIIIILINPFTLFYVKSSVVVSKVERATKVGLLHLYDLAVLMWVLQWLINPYPTLFKLRYITLIQFLPALITFLVTFGVLLPLIALSIKNIGFGTLLLSIVPFVLNEELAARAEFCHMALEKPTRVRVYPEEGGSVEGFVGECDMDKITIDDGKSTRVFSWGDVHQIELL